MHASETHTTDLTSADRVLVLLALLRGGQALSVTAAAAELGVAGSTAHRLLNTLMRHGYAKQDHRRRYVHCAPTTPGSSTEIDTSQLVAMLRDALRRLVSATGETVHFEMLHGNHVRYIAGHEGTGSTLRVGLRIGASMPAFTCAGGRAMLATLPNIEVERLHSDGLPAWRTAKVASLPSLKRSLARVRRDGYATALNETEAGVFSLGVAVMADSFLGAFAVALPAARLDRASLPRMVVAMNDECTALAEEIGKRMLLGGG